MGTDRKKIIDTFGDPMAGIEARRDFEMTHMTLWNCKEEFPDLPFRRIYLNKYILEPLRKVFAELQEKGYLKELKTYDGCFNPRYVRGYEAQKIASMHAWGLAVDFNAEENCLGCQVKFSCNFLDIWRSNGWTVGADFRRLDGMHFQYTKDFQKQVA